MRCEFHPEALAEYTAAARHYAGCQDGLELRFMASVEAVVGQIAAAPDRWRVLEQDVRRCLTKVFPYAILYTIEPDRVLIIAVMHCHREPGYRRERLQRNAEPTAPPNSRPPSPCPTSPDVQPPDSLRTSSSGGCG